MGEEYKDFENLENNIKEGQAGADITMNDIERLQRALAEEKLKVEQATEMALRMKAEADNTRKRAVKDVEHAHKYGMEKFIKELLVIMDTFELGLASVAAITEQVSLDFAQAMKMTHKMLLDNMANFGVSQINPQGEAFDPKLHEALSLQHTDEYAPNTVVAVLQPGFILHDRVLRPARVVVAKPL
jgi:molecular chaperone GrpE